MTATPAFDEVQTTSRVIVIWELSLKVPIAVNCSELPRLMDALAGVTEIELNLTLVTVRSAVALWFWNTAEIMLVPAETPVAEPESLIVLLIVATEGMDEVHVTAEVKSSCWPSSKFPIAVNGIRIVSGTLAF